MKNRLISILALATLSWSSAPAMALATQHQMHIAVEGARPASKNQDHSCCPEGPPQFLFSTFVIPAQAPLPCEDSPCCARQAPTSSPSVAGTIRVSRPDSNRAALGGKVDPKQDLRVQTKPGNLDTGAIQPSSIRSTVLRN